VTPFVLVHLRVSQTQWFRETETAQAPDHHVPGLGDIAAVTGGDVDRLDLGPAPVSNAHLPGADYDWLPAPFCRCNRTMLPGQESASAANRRPVKDQTDMAGHTALTRMSQSVSLDDDQTRGARKPAQGSRDDRSLAKVQQTRLVGKPQRCMIKNPLDFFKLRERDGNGTGIKSHTTKSVGGIDGSDQTGISPTSSRFNSGSHFFLNCKRFSPCNGPGMKYVRFHEPGHSLQVSCQPQAGTSLEPIPAAFFVVVLYTTCADIHLNKYINRYGSEQEFSPVSYTHLTLPTSDLV